MGQSALIGPFKMTQAMHSIEGLVAGDVDLG
jgi:hypothetical protein